VFSPYIIAASSSNALTTIFRDFCDPSVGMLMTEFKDICGITGGSIFGGLEETVEVLFPF
jgi:hypothetical protein